MALYKLSMGFLGFVLFFYCTNVDAAPKPKTLLVLKIEHSGLDSTLVDTLNVALRQEIDRVFSQTKLLPVPALATQDMRLAAGCAEEGNSCLIEIGQMLGASQVLRGAFSGTGERAKFFITLVDTKTRKVRTKSYDFEDLQPDSVAEFRWVVATAFGPKTSPPPGKITIAMGDSQSQLPDSEVFLNEKLIRTPGEIENLAPKMYRVEIRKPGVEAFVWQGLLRPGREVHLSYRAQPTRGISQGSVISPEVPSKNSASLGTVIESVALAHDPPRPEEKTHDVVYAWWFSGGAVLATALTIGFAAKVNSLQTDCRTLGGPSGGCMGTDLERRGERVETAEWISLGAALVLGTLAATAYIIETNDGP